MGNVKMLEYFERCFFCGDNDLHGYPVMVIWGDRHGFAVECYGCGARGPFGGDMAEAVAKFRNPAVKKEEFYG